MLDIPTKNLYNIGPNNIKQKTPDQVVEQIDKVILQLKYMHGNSINGTTPFSLCQQMVEKTVKPHNTILDLACGKGSFLLAAIRHLIVSGMSVNEAVDSVYGVDSSQSQIDHTRVNIERATGYIPRLECVDSLTWETDLKFDVILSNPPYFGKAQLHQKFFNLAIDLCVDHGTICFIQPATPYLNKKLSRAIEGKMKKHLVFYNTDAIILPSTTFANAQISGDVAVTTLVKTHDTSGTINSVTYKNNVTYYDVPLEHVNYLSMDPKMYASLSKKIDQYITANGSLLDRSYYKLHCPVASIAKLQKVRGHVEHADFFTFISDNDDYWTKDITSTSDFGIQIDDNNQLANVYIYLQSYIARFGLALRKFNSNNHMGEFAKVPLVDFDNAYNDKQLCAMIGITDAEYAAILEVIAPYHRRLVGE
jgi:predicted RNA methylase